MASDASAAIVTGQLNGSGHNAYSYTSSNMTYEDGSAYSAGINFIMLCIDYHSPNPSYGGTYSFDAGVGAAALVGGGGALGISALYYLLDNYYEEYFTGGDIYEQRAFNHIAQEVGTDLDENDIAGSWLLTRSPTYPSQATYMTARQTMFDDLGAALPTLAGYVSTKYSLDFFEGRDTSGVQNFMVISELPEIAPVPLPAALPLLVVGLGAMGFVARKKRAQA